MPGDERFATNPFVTGERGHIRFYASSPLITPGGVAIGTLCVFDDEEGDLTAEQSAALDLLAHQAVEVLLAYARAGGAHPKREPPPLRGATRGRSRSS